MISINGSNPFDIANGGNIKIQKAVVQQLFGISSVAVNDEDSSDEVGGLGLPVWGSVTLGDDATEYKRNGETIKPGRLYIPCCIIDVTGTNNIVKTQLQGSTRRGTVKEYVSEGDYAISIKGILSNNDPSWPANLIVQMHKYKSANISIRIQNKLLDKLQIDKIVIESLKWPGKQGFKNIQPFELSCISEQDDEFTYYEKQKLNGNTVNK